VIQGGNRQFLLQISLFKAGEQTHGTLQRQAYVVERTHLARCIPLRIELVVEGTVLVNHCFQGGKALIFLQIGLFS
jgi:hypothetical protein